MLAARWMIRRAMLNAFGTDKATESEHWHGGLGNRHRVFPRHAAGAVGYGFSQAVLL
jgi:hypothetical protein